jgi:hypothetical protein
MQRLLPLLQRARESKFNTFAILSLLLLAIPVTVVLSQQAKDLRQHADSYQATLSLTPQSASPGQSITVSWNIGTMTSTQPTITPAPTRGAADCLYEQKSEEYSCQDGFRCYNDYFKDATTACEWQPKRNDNGLWYHCDKDNACSTGTRGTRDLPPDSNRDRGFLFIPKAYAQTTLTGSETLRLYAITPSGTSQQLGHSIYLNCSMTTPPTSPITTGSCPFTISADMTTSVSLSYTIRLLASDGLTVLGEAPVTLRAKNQQTNIYAAPNLCILNAQGTCTTYLSWKAPSFPNVTLRVKSTPSDTTSSLVAAGNIQEGIEIPWITSQGAFFELYSGNTVIESILVKGITPTLTATPNPCTLTAQGTCSTTLFWNVSGTSDVQIRVRANSQPNRTNDPLVASGTSGSTSINWITAANPTFDLYIGNAITPVTSLQVKGVTQ